MSAVYQPPLPSKKTEISQHESVSSLISSASLTATRTKAGQTIPPTSDLQRAFVARKDELLNSIITSRTLIQDLKGASSRGFVVQYPLRPKGAHDEPPVSSETFRATLPAVDSGLTPETDEACGLGAQSHALPDADLPDIPELRVLGIDVKTNGKSSSSLIGSLEASSVANLLQEKLAEATGYLDRLFKRVSDTSSKVFVTGDLNAGKSTFVNALLRREVVPQDQQPCTTHFCEVVDANQNDGREEVHAIRDPERYDRMDSTTFDRYDIRHLPMMVTENAEKNDYNLFKVYCNDQRPAAESLIKNGLVDISLIDSPGLNIDSLKTTANFAKQEDIDVVVFMVHAENQFTLSGKEFLQNAGKEKGYVFIVVNRFDMIEDQERCKRDILEQVRKLSPQTYTDAKNLVHFVSARATLRAGPAAEAPTDFAQLEKSLRTFVLEKRFQSKLAPAKTYLKNLLTDVEVIAKYNASVAEERKARAVRDLDDAEPSYAQMLDVKERILDDIDRTIDNTSSEVQQHTRRKLDDFLDNIEEHGRGTSWPGLLYAFTYATNVRSRLYRMAAGRVRQAELFRVEKSRDCIAHLEKAITECLPASDDPVQGMPKQVLEGGLTSGAEQSDAAGAFVPSEVSVELADFFDLSDRLELVREYIPSLTMIASGMYGYAKIADEVFKHGYQGLVNLGRFAFVSLAVAGIGAFVYTLTDMEHVLTRKMARKVRQQLQQLQWAETHVERLGRATRRDLRMSIWDLQNRFYRQLDDTKKKRSQIETIRDQADKALQFWNAVLGQTSGLESTVETIDVEDQAAVSAIGQG